MAENARSRQWKLDNPEKAKANHLRYRFKLTIDDFNTLLEKAENKCESCGKEFTMIDKNSTPHVDHDHKCCSDTKTCGKCIRGLLCGVCNLICGSVDDNPNALINIAKYLSRHSDLDNPAR